MIESIHFNAIRKHGQKHTSKGKAILLGDQRPSFGSGFNTCADMLKTIGYDEAISIDYDGKATVWADLNNPVEPELYGWADLVFDGGVIEHVCNIGQALQSMVRLCKVGGVVVHANPIYCWGDSYYGVDPQLFKDFYKLNGFQQFELTYYYRGGWRTWVQTMVRRWVPTHIVDKIRKKLAKSESAKWALLKDDPNDIHKLPVDNNREMRKLPLNTHVMYVGRKWVNVDKIEWPAQGMYPKAGGIN